MSKKNKIEMLEETLDRKLTVAEMYANRPRKWLLYTAIVLIIAVLIGWSANDIHFTGLTATGTEVAKGVVHGVFHPDTDLMFGSGDSDVPYLLLQTIAIAVLGTLFGAILAIPFAFLASFNIMPKPVAYVVRVLILMIRTIPSIVWALMWIRVTGPGPFAGVLTLTLCSVGLLAKRFLIAIDDIQLEPYRAYRAMGISIVRSIRWAVLPQLGPRYGAAILYRFDVNLRDAAILGLVGAGGIGTPLILAMMHYEWAAAGALLWGMVGLVTIVEIFSEWLRKKQRI